MAQKSDFYIVTAKRHLNDNEGKLVKQKGQVRPLRQASQRLNSAQIKKFEADSFPFGK